MAGAAALALAVGVGAMASFASAGLSTGLGSAGFSVAIGAGAAFVCSAWVAGAVSDLLVELSQPAIARLAAAIATATERGAPAWSRLQNGHAASVAKIWRLHVVHRTSSWVISVCRFRARGNALQGHVISEYGFC
jgi:hypothetical protein